MLKVVWLIHSVVTSTNRTYQRQCGDESTGQHRKGHTTHRIREENQSGSSNEEPFFPRQWNTFQDLKEKPSLDFLDSMTQAKLSSPKPCNRACVCVCVCVCVCARARALSSVQCKEAANENLLLNVTLFMLLFFSVVVVLCVCLKNAITSQTTK